MSLTDAAIRAAKPGDKTIKLFDSLGLYLEISPAGGRWWRLKYRLAGKERRISLGVYPVIGLKEARKRRDEAKELLAQGLDPSAQRQAEKEAVKRQQKAEAQTFKAVALQWWESYGPTLAERTRDRTQRYLDQDLLPALGDAPVASIMPADLLAVAAPAEKRGASNTAHKLMTISNQVMRHAYLCGLTPVMDAIKLLIQFGMPRTKAVSIPITLPGGPDGVLAALEAGTIAPDEAKVVMDVHLGRAKIREVEELEQRLAALERAVQEKGDNR